MNEDELLPILKHHGFQVLIAEEHDVVEQIQIFSQVTHLIAPHGAGLVNGIFAETGATILEIRPVISSGDYCFDDLFQCGEFQHEVLVPKKRGRFLLDPELLDDTLRRWEQIETSLRRFACV